MTAQTEVPAAPASPAAAQPNGGGPRASSHILRRKVRRDLGRSRWQFAAVVVTIVLGVMLYAASYDSFLNLTASYQETYDRLAFADVSISGGDQEAVTEQASGTDGVEAVTNRVQADVPIQVDGDHKLVGRIVGLPVDAQPAVNQVDVLEGTYLDASNPFGVLVETHMAGHFDLEPGDTFAVLLQGGMTEVQMVGEVASAEYIWPARSRQDLITTPDDFGVVFVPEEMAAQAPPSTQVPQTLVLYDDDADVEVLDETLREMATDAGAQDVMTQEDQPSNAALSEDLQGFNELSFLFPLLFLTAAGMATFIMLNRIVHSQRGQIGTLVANGLGRRRVLRHYMSYGIVIGLTGAIAGILLGLPLGNLITGSYTSALSIPDTVTRFHPVTPIVGLLFGVVMGLLAAWAPARAAVKVPPAEAMRGSTPRSGSHTSLLERVIPPLRRLPVRWRMTLRGIGRSKRRSISTVIGVALAIILILASWGMIDTVQLLLDRQFVDIQHDDAQVFLRVPVDAAALEGLEGVDGVGEAEAVITLDTTLRNGGDQYSTELQAFDAGTAMHSFFTPGGDEISLPDEGVLAGASVMDLLGVEKGDTVTLSFPSLGTEVAVPIADFVDEPLGTMVYMQRDALAGALAGASPPVGVEALASPAVSSAMVIYEGGVGNDEMRTRLSEVGSVIAVVTSNAIKDLMDQILALFYAFVGIMLVFGGIMAFALVFNTISVNIAERAPELANMRANGVSPRQINHLMTAENMLLTLIGIPIGLLLGYLVSWAFMNSFSSDLFDFTLAMRPTTFLFTSLAIILVTLVSQWPGLRAIRRLDIATVVRERSQ